MATTDQITPESITSLLQVRRAIINLRSKYPNVMDLVVDALISDEFSGDYGWFEDAYHPLGGRVRAPGETDAEWEGLIRGLKEESPARFDTDEEYQEAVNNLVPITNYLVWQRQNPHATELHDFDVHSLVKGAIENRLLIPPSGSRKNEGE